MVADGQHEQDPEMTVKGNNDITSTVPQDRAGVAEGAAGEIPTKYKADSAIQISEVFSNRRYSKTLYVAKHRKNPETGKIEYQLRETKEDTGVSYRDRWFPENQVSVLR